VRGTASNGRSYREQRPSILGASRLQSLEFDSTVIRRYSGLATSEQDHVPQHQDLVQFRSAGGDPELVNNSALA
jgi:hypothetical protein